MLRSILFLLAACLHASPFATAQDAMLSGRVTDTAGNALQGAHVRLSGRDRASTTDADGDFHFLSLPADSLRLIVTHLGYAPHSRTIAPTPGEHVHLTIQLRERPVAMGEVTVSATLRSDLQRNVPQPVTVLTAAQLRRGAALNLADALDAEAGLTLVRDGVWGTDVSIRGLSRANVVTLVDGVRIETATAHAAGMSLIDISDVERIEVIRGGSSSMYGTAATGCVVNVISREGQYTPAPVLHGAMSGRYASANNGSSGSLSLDAANSMAFVHLHGALRSAEDVRTPSGTLRDSRYRDRSISLAGGLRLAGETELLLRWQNVYAEDVGIPGGESFPEQASARYPDEERSMLSGELRSGPLGTALRQLSLRYAWQRIDRNVELIPNPAVTLRPSAEHAMHSVRAASHWSLGAHQLYAGLDGWERAYDGIRLREFQQSGNVVADLPLPPARFLSLGGYVQDEVAFYNERLRVSVGGRLDAIRVTNDAAYDLVYTVTGGVRDDAPAARQLRWEASESNEQSWSAHAGLLWQATDMLALTANVSRAFRAPSLEERYQYIELGPVTYVGDPDLSAEKGDMFDLGLRCNGEDFALRVNGYLRSMHDLVVDGRVSDSLYRKINVGEATIYGLEAMAEYDVWDGLLCSLTVSALRGRDTAADQDLPQMPPLQGTASLHMPLCSLLRLDVTAMFAADQEALAPGEERTPGFMTAAVRLRSVPLRYAGTALQLEAGIENLFDRDWRRHVSTLRGLLRSEAGRNAYVHVRLAW